MTLWKKPFENIVGKGENAGFLHFLLFLNANFSMSLKVGIVWQRLKENNAGNQHYQHF